MNTELAILAGRVDLLLEGVGEAGSIAARRFALDALARGLLWADPGSVDASLLERARALRVDPSTIAAAEMDRLPHAVAVPLVARDASFGLVRQVYVTFDPVGLADHGLLEDDARSAVAAAIEVAARRAPPPSDPARHCLVAAQPRALRHAHIEGRSLSAAAFVSATALFTSRPVRAGVAVTGELRGDRVLAVGDIEAKVRAAMAHGLATLVVPEANAAAARAIAERSGVTVGRHLPMPSRSGATDVIAEPSLAIAGVSDAGELLAATLSASASPRTSPDRALIEARELVERGWSGYRWPSIRERLARLSGALPEYRLDLRVEILARLAAAERHLGDPRGSLSLLREAEGLVRSDEGRRAVPDAPISYLYMQMAMTYRQLSRFAEATRAAERSVRVARAARLRRELIKALGCLGLVAIARGRLARAILVFDESLALTLRHEPDRTARTHAYLIEAHGAAGDEARAREHFEAAMRSLAGGDRAAEESWVRTSFGGALIALGRAREAIEALEVDAVLASIAETPLPGLLARRHLGLALSRAGELDRGLPLLAASPLVHGRALEPHLAFVAHLNVLFEARERIAHGAWSPDIAGRARLALEHVPRESGAFLGRTLERTRALLEREPPKTVKPLDALLARCVRLG